MRRAEEHQLVEHTRPALAGLLRVVHGTARQQPAHAVAQHRETLQRARPCVDQPLEQIGELTAVARNMQPAVVVQVQRRAAEVARERRAVVVAVALPLQIVHAQAVHQHQQVRAGRGPAHRQRGGFDQHRPAFAAQGHRRRQRVGGCHEVIAQHAVERRHDRFALPACAGRAGGIERIGSNGERRHQQREQRVDAAAHHPRDAANRLVDQAGDAARAAVGRCRREPGQPADAFVHRLHQVREAGGRVGRQAHGTAQVGNARLAGRWCATGHRESSTGQERGLTASRHRWPAAPAARWGRTRAGSAH